MCEVCVCVCVCEVCEVWGCEVWGVYLCKLISKSLHVMFMVVGK